MTEGGTAKPGADVTGFTDQDESKDQKVQETKPILDQVSTRPWVAQGLGPGFGMVSTVFHGGSSV